MASSEPSKPVEDTPITTTAATTTTTTPKFVESTFRNHTPAQAAAYAALRAGYPAELIRIIMEMHSKSFSASASATTDSPSGSAPDAFGTLIDVGCGPANSTIRLAPLFNHVIGLDAGEAMITTARGWGLKDKNGGDVQFEVSTAEDIVSKLVSMGVEEGTVDCITAATAAHWFDMSAFYEQAGRMLRPGGNLIIWSSARMYADKRTTKGWEEVQRVLDSFDAEFLKDYEEEGNRIVRGLYVDLGKPWDGDGGGQGGKYFKKEDFTYRTFNDGGELEDLGDGKMGFIREFRQMPFQMVKKILGTASPVVRWREANKERVERGEIKDCVDEMLETIKRVAEEQAGEEVTHIDGGLSMALLMFRKSVN